MPIHHGLTKRKLFILERLTARLGFCVHLFSKLIEERDMRVTGFGEFTPHDITEIKQLTKLSISYVQQCRDQALWTWRSYHAQHREWETRLKHAKGKWREKLVKREPHKPFQTCSISKIPVRMDRRTGEVQASRKIRIAPVVLRLSTLQKNYRITVPLNPAQYHLNLLKKGRIIDFQLVKSNGWFYAHVCIKYDVPDRPVRAVIGVDLGVKRAMATVLLKPHAPLHREDLTFLTDGEKKHQLDKLNHRFAELQRHRKWAALRHLRHKRRHVADYFDRLDAIRIAEMAASQDAAVAVGYPKGIKYDNYRGNGQRLMRRVLQQRFSYGQRTRYILEECTSRGIIAEVIPEFWTSRRCHRCGSMNTCRPSQSLFLCFNCGIKFNADWNSAINIGSVLFAERLGPRARAGLAYAGDELVHKPASPEVKDIAKI